MSRHFKRVRGARTSEKMSQVHGITFEPVSTACGRILTWIGTLGRPGRNLEANAYSVVARREDPKLVLYRDIVLVLAPEARPSAGIEVLSLLE